MKFYPRWALWVALLPACAPAGDDTVQLVGALYDSVPEVVFSDPAGIAAHRVADGALIAYSTDDLSGYSALDERPLDALMLAAATFSESDPGSFTLSDPALTAGVSLSLVASAPGRAPTVFSGVVPEVAAQYGWFSFFSGALFTEAEAVLADRVRGLAGEGAAAVPDPAASGNGCLVYGQLLSDPSLGADDQITALEGLQVRVVGHDGGPLEAQYLSGELTPDDALRATSSAGVFYRAGVPEGPLSVQVYRDGRALGAPFATLCVEDGMSWLAAFYVVGEPPAPSP